MWEWRSKEQCNLYVFVAPSEGLPKELKEGRWRRKEGEFAWILLLSSKSKQEGFEERKNQKKKKRKKGKKE